MDMKIAFGDVKEEIKSIYKGGKLYRKPTRVMRKK